MLFGGGGGGYDPKPDEAAREKEYADAIRRINATFGYVPEGAPAPPMDKASYLSSIGQLPAPVSSTIDEGVGYPSNRRNAATSGNQAYADYLKTQSGGNPYGYQDFGYGHTLQPDSSLYQSALENQKQINKGLTDTRQGTMDFLTEKLNRLYGYDQEAVNRSVRGRGLSGGSDSLESQRRMAERYDDTLLDVGNTADTAVNNIRTADEAARVNIINSIRNGMDAQSAIASAKSNLASNQQNAYLNAQATQFGDVFGDIRDLYKGYQVSKGRSDVGPPNSKTGSYYGNRPSFGGTLQNNPY